MANVLIDRLADPAVRDLAWAIGSPGLLEASHPAYDDMVVSDAWCSMQLESSEAWLTGLDRFPHPLHEFIGAHPTRRLGHYFEVLIQFWITHKPETELIAANMQVQDKQRTLGEYDFLFRDVSGSICHWETAVKFYLQREPLSVQSTFIGPGARDRLDIKLNKVFHQQLRLSKTPAGLQALPRGIKLDKAQAFIKGYLFYHASVAENMSIPGISKSHLRGWWIRHSLEILPSKSTVSRWITLPRLSWLAPARLPEHTEPMQYEAVIAYLDEHFKNSQDAILLFEMQRSLTGTWQEISRGFVVCKIWPIMDVTDNTTG